MILRRFAFFPLLGCRKSGLDEGFVGMSYLHRWRWLWLVLDIMEDRRGISGFVGCWGGDEGFLRIIDARKLIDGW